MTASLTVPKIPVYPPSMDYRLLRREGMRHLERFGSALWTDFNSHDPGVTMLEVLCYALTDLGYRSQLPDAELFNTIGETKAFFTAAQVLPNAPVTALDFRKILIDIEGVKNAWLESEGGGEAGFRLSRPAGEVALSFAAVPVLQLPKVDKTFVFGSIIFNIPDPDDSSKKIGSLEGYLKKRHALAGKKNNKALKGLDKGFRNDILKYIKETLQENGLKAWLLEYAKNDLYKTSGILAFLQNTGYTLSRARFIGNLGKITELVKINNRAGAIELLSYNLQVADTDDELAYFLYARPLLSQFYAGLEAGGEEYSLFNIRGIYKIYLQLEEGYEPRKREIRADAHKRLHQHRALCEDFAPEVIFIDKAPVSIDTTLEIAPEADPIEVYAQLLYKIENFFSPTIGMYSLQEMMDRYASFILTADTFEKLTEAEIPIDMVTNLQPLIDSVHSGRSAWETAVASAIGAAGVQDYGALIFTHTQKKYDSNQVFDGPLLQHGFIDDTELEAASWRRVVYKSDLFKVISDIAGITRVTGLKVQKCPADDKNEETREGEWCLSFTCHCQPALDIHCPGTDIRFTQKGYPVDFNEFMKYEALARLEQLRSQKSKIDRTGDTDLPIPAGVQRDDLAEYTSIQEEFPRTYHVGREGIARTATASRKARVKQLKGFLMFFDQVLANYLAQLAGVRDILAIDRGKGQSRPFQTLYDAPNIAPLFAGLDPGRDWKSFRSDPANSYIKALEALTQGSDLAQQQKRSRVMDHLLARFGEQFTDYALKLFQVEQPLDESTDAGVSVEDWLADKQRMLKKLPGLSGRRGTAFNYQPEPQDDFRHFLNSKNVEGFKKRVLARLGVKSWERNMISCSPGFNTEIRTETINKSKRYRFGIKEEPKSGDYRLLSTAVFSRRDAAEKALEELYTDLASGDNFYVVEQGKYHYVGFTNGDGKTFEKAMLLSSPMREQTDADTLLETIRKLITRQCQHENFHVVEHLLLRPIDANYELLKTVGEVEDDLELLDSYSFQLTILVPAWVNLFRNEVRYGQFKDLVRQELPAHVRPYFVELNTADMLTFENSYFEWLRLKTQPKPEASALRAANNLMVDFLNQHLRMS